MGKRSKATLNMENKDDESGQSKSRSAKKRESAALQKLGENLTKIKPEARKNLPLSQDLLDALAFHDSLTEREAARRQRQYIGKLMRYADVPAIMAALEKLESPHAAQMARFHAAETWREKLLSAPALDAALEDFFKTYHLNPEFGEKKDLASLAGRARELGGSDPALKRNLFRLILSFLEKSGN